MASVLPRNPRSIRVIRDRWLSRSPCVEKPSSFGKELRSGEARGADAASDEGIGRGAVKADGVAHRPRTIEALGEEGAHHSREHVAGAAARESRVARGVDR